MLDKASELIFGMISALKGKEPDKSIVKKLVYLHPSGDIGALYRDFCMRRIRLALLMLLSGLVLGLFMKISVMNEKSVPDNGFERSEWSGKKQRLELYAISGDRKTEIDVTLDVREPGPDELDSYSEKFEEDIRVLILGENADADHICSDLLLKEKYDGYPFKCTWRSSDPKLISAYGGRVNTSSEGEVTLTLTYSYGDYVKKLDLPVYVVRPEMTDEELFGERLEDYLSLSQEETREVKMWNLPSEYDGQKLRWEYRVEDDSFMIFAVFATVAAVIYMASEKDLSSKAGKKKENMKASYPKILRQLALYIGAGMTVKAAFSRIAEDAPEKSEEFIFEEMKIACLEMSKGIGEIQVYERFGKRTGLSEYIKLSGLLSQNLKRGNPEFLIRLKEEAYSSMHEKVLESRKAGEKAQTKLLVPMMMMLAVVMVMIMIPVMTGIKI